MTVPHAETATTAELPENAIETVALTKIYRGSETRSRRTALDAVDLVVPRGSLFGLLGPNGAGKSTFINILAGLATKTSGSVRVWGRDLDADSRNCRAAIGVVPQELNIDAFFTPRQLLDVQAGLYGVPAAQRRTDELLERVGLTDKSDAYARSLSGGMRRRMLIAKAMVHDPPVLVLDEPSAGVDVELRQQLWEYVRELNARGTTIVLTTHYLEEAQQLCDRIAIINHGHVICCEDTADLLRRLDRKELAINVAEDLDAVPESLGGFDVALAGPRRLNFHYRPSETRIRDLLTAVRDSGLTITDLTTQEGDLEDIFLELTRRPAEPDATGA
ncbi:MAG: ABC transporter ATP-binding protein [Alphaproteobacteria bacterium]|nr:ABC transporter ATP-binding protein [Alphaproteobacteria bacterium]